jgi:hypothetical protein
MTTEQLASEALASTSKRVTSTSRKRIDISTVPQFSERMDVKSFMQTVGLIKVDPMVKESEETLLPFVTFENANEETLSIWFSTKQSENRAKGDVIEKGFFDNLRIMWTTNNSGESRLKIASAGELKPSVSIDDLF